MLRNNYLRLAGCALILASTLAGCAQSDAPEEASAVNSSEPPVARLGNAVVPVRYQIELKIDPTQDRFSGVVSIDVSVNEARDTIWLHGKGLNIAEAYLTDSESKRIDASYEETDESG